LRRVDEDVGGGDSDRISRPQLPCNSGWSVGVNDAVCKKVDATRVGANADDILAGAKLFVGRYVSQDRPRNWHEIGPETPLRR